MIRVMLADDEALIRAGIRLVLQNAADIEIAAEASGGQEAVELARRHHIDVALLDIRMADGDGLTAAAEIRRLVARTQVVMLTTFGEEESVAHAMRAGAAGFLLKDAAPEDIIQAVRTAARGEAVLSPRITRQLIDRYMAPENTRASKAKECLSALTSKEREVVALVGEGLSNAEIARSLLISEGTAKVHVSRILTKLGCTNRVQAAILARDAGLLPPT